MLVTIQLHMLAPKRPSSPRFSTSSPHTHTSTPAMREALRLDFYSEVAPLATLGEPTDLYVTTMPILGVHFSVTEKKGNVSSYIYTQVQR